METLHLYVSVPVAGFRVAQAREYWETYPVPPPSTVYGMLLSMVGESNRLVHRGVQIAIALVSAPDRSVVLRTLWRVKSAKLGPGQGNNACPGYQELLTNVCLSVWICDGGDDRGSPTLFARVKSALAAPPSVSRFGGLALGESTHLVNEVRLWRNGDPVRGQLLAVSPSGDLSLPVWPDHVGSKGTRWGQFTLREDSVVDGDHVPDEGWVCMQPVTVEP